MIIHAVRLAAALCFALGMISGANAAEPTGTWLTQNGDAHIRVAKCGPSMCGTIVWLRDPIDPQTGQPQVDDNNPNAALRNRKIIGHPHFLDGSRWQRRLCRRHLQRR